MANRQQVKKTLLSGGAAAVINEPGPLTITPTLGSELVVNGNMETGDPPSSWVAGANTTLSSAADERTGGAGAACLQVLNAAAATAEATQAITVVVDTWYQVLVWQRRVDSNVQYRASNIGDLVSGPANNNTTWAQSPGTGRATATPCTITLRNTQATINRIGHFDDVSLKAITTASMFTTYAVKVEASAQADITAVDFTQAGIVHYVDASNFVIAYLNRSGELELVKVVAGTGSALASVAVTYSAGATFKLVRSGSNYAVTYNGSQLIAPTAIADAVFASATQWGIFSTWAANSFANVLIQ